MKIKNLIENARNPRKISKKKLGFFEKSYKTYGNLSGIVYNANLNELVCGHQHKKILPEDLEPVIEVANHQPDKYGTLQEGYFLWDDIRIRYREVWWEEALHKGATIAANRGAGEWEMSILSETLLELDAMNFDMDLTMYDADELENIIVPVEKVPEEEEDESVPEVLGEPITKPGDVWVMDDHRVMCGDATDIDAVNKLLGGNVADIVYTDPPYGISEPGDRAKRRTGQSREADSQNFENIIGDDSIDTAVAAFSVATSLSETVCYWGGNHFAHKLPASPCWLIWDKRENDENRDTNSDCELAYVKHPSKKSVRIFRHLWKGMIKKSENGEARVHPTQKPIALAEWCINELAPDSQIVVDLFGGSGSTLLACEKLGKSCFVMEMSPRYVDTIKLRWETKTGKTAVLQGQSDF